jgi:hypothetical protein
VLVQWAQHIDSNDHFRKTTLAQRVAQARSSRR